MRLRRSGVVIALAALAVSTSFCGVPSSREASAPAPSTQRSTQTKSPRADPEAPGLKIATWNIAWLTTRDPRGRRKPEDYEALRRYAQALDADIVALQEVDGPEGAMLVFDPAEYRFHFTHDSNNVQRAGLAWKKGIDVRTNPDVTSLAMSGRRPGADVTVRFGGREIRLLAVHLKSGCPEKPLGSADEDCTILRAQLPGLEAWVDARARDGIPFAVLGDFNRAFGSRDTFWADLDDGDPPAADLTDAGASARPACWGGRHDRYIDHIVLSPDAAAWLAPHSFHELVYEAAADPNGGLSDHCPLSVVLGGAQDRADGGASAQGAPGPATDSAAGRGTTREAVPIGTQEAADHVGQLATVCGKVASGRYMADGSRVTLINLDAPYPDQPFTLVIRAADREHFGTPETSWAGRRICVTGTIETYRGKPQIVARNPDQIQVEL